MRQIQYFICLYEEKSVTKAAKRLNIVQPALSMQITRLESEVGRELFSRTPRGMHATPAGDEMYSLFLPVVSSFLAAKSKVTHQAKSLSGYARVGLMSSIGHRVLPDVLAQFTQEHPQVTLSLTEGLTDSLCESVADGRLDLAFVNQPRRDCNLVQENVLREEVFAVSSARSGQKLSSKQTLQELATQKLILPTREHGLRMLLDDYAKKLGVTLIPALELDSVLALAVMVNDGPYLTFLPGSVIDNLKERAGIHLRTHRLVTPPLQRQVVYVYNPQRVPSAAAQAFAQLLMTALRQLQGDAMGSVVELRRLPLASLDMA
jgi:DNA-binding transcriptional LysR family regulator